jgi:hypothetical protein
MTFFGRKVDVVMMVLAGALTPGLCAQPPATAPATEPAAGAAHLPGELASRKALVQLRLGDGMLELYTSHGVTDQIVPVRLDDPRLIGQLRIASRSTEPAPYRPDIFSLKIEQADGKGLAHIDVFATAGNLPLTRDTVAPGRKMSVQLIQSGLQEVEDDGIRLYIQVIAGDEQLEHANFPAADFPTLIRRYPEPTDEYIRPILDALGGQEQLLDVPPALAAEVLSDRMAPDANVKKAVAALVAKLDADRPQERNAAQGELEKMGVAAALALRSMDTSRLSLEQQTRIRTVLAPLTHAPGVNVQKLRSNVHFLLDTLNCRDSTARRAALEELQQHVGRPIAFDIQASDEARLASLRQLRRELTTPATAPTTQPAK